MITLMKRVLKILTAAAVCTAIPLNAFALEAELSEAGDGGFLLKGNIGSSQTNRNVAVTVYKPGMTAKNITRENPLSALYDLGQATADSNGDFEYRIEGKESTGNLDGYRVVVSDYTGEEITLNDEPMEELSSDKMGHIYFNGDNVDFNLEVLTTDRTSTNVQIEAKVYRLDIDADTGENVAVGEPVAAITRTEATNEGGGLTTPLDFTNDLKGKYGVFRIDTYVTDTNLPGKTGYHSTRFSKVNAERGGDNTNYRMGVAQHLQTGTKNGYYGAQDSDKYYDLFADAGYYMQREELHWSNFNSNGGVKYNSADGTWTYDYGTFSLRSDQKQYLDQMKEKGLKPLLILGLINKNYLMPDPEKIDNYDPANIDRSQLALEQYLRPSENPGYIDAYEEYCYRAVLATIDYTDSYEIMNEYNIDGFNEFLDFEVVNGNKIYNYTKADFEEYVAMMRAAYNGAHRAAAEKNKEITVYGIASAQIADYRSEANNGYYYFTDDNTMSQFPANQTYKWIEGILENRSGQYMDALSCHIYTASYKPEETSGDKAAHIEDIKHLLKQYNCENMPVFISETGYSTNLDSYRITHTEADQAKYELRDWARLYNKVTGVSWYNGIEKPNTSSYEHYLGHIKMHKSWTNESESVTWNVEIPYEAKRVYLALANWNTLLANSELTSENVDGVKYDYVFETPDGRTVHMLWNSDDSEGTVSVNASASNVVLYDMYGNTMECPSNGGTYTVSVSGEPVYLVDNSKPLRLENENGDEVKVLSDTVYLKADEAYSSEMGSAYVIAALYNGDTLIDCITKDFATLAAERVVISAAGADRMSVYLWDDLTTLKPINKKQNLQGRKIKNELV